MNAPSPVVTVCVRGILSVAAVALAPESFAANCEQTSTGRIPISDLGGGLYLNQYQGGLYPNGSNVVPPEHASAGQQLAEAVAPLNSAGEPDPNGKYILLSIGMSNTTQEFSTFINQAANHPLVNHTTLRIIDGAAGGQTAGTWDSTTDQNYDRIRDDILIPQGLSEAQVQAAWVKVANAGPSVSLPSTNADAFTLLAQSGNIVRAIRVRYPNIKVVFLSSRIYAGYASTGLNPEPYAYESAFAVKWLIEAQIEQMASKGSAIDPIAGDLNYDAADGVAPWLAWGPYLWADGLIPRSDGLIWECSNLANDGTHPSNSGRQKVANMLMNFMLNSPFAEPWFEVVIEPDVTGDQIINIDDLLAVISAWGPCPPPAEECSADVNSNGVVNLFDLLTVIANWS
ncbi:MAG: dockerin type I domain-containing protein [Phycisphaerales bacterium]|nr:dockerin type I domain-containing protein [Phycisphaerales bacterium]